MRNLLIIGLLLPSFCSFGSSANAEMVLAEWSFASPVPFGTSPLNAISYLSNAFEATPNLTRGPGVVDTGGGHPVDSFGGRVWQDAATDYLQFSISTLPGATASFSSIGPYQYLSENASGANAGPTTGTWAYSINGGSFASIQTVIITRSATLENQDAISVSTISALQNFSGTAIFRLTATGGGNNGYFVLSGQNFTLNGTAVPEPTSLLLAGFAGAGGLLGFRFRRRQGALDDALETLETAE